MFTFFALLGIKYAILTLASVLIIIAIIKAIASIFRKKKDINVSQNVHIHHSPNVRFCTHCGSENLVEAKFCKYCGHTLN